MDFTCFDYVTVGVCIIDEKFSIVWWNRRLEEWTGKKRETVTGQSLGQLFPHFTEEKYKSRITGLFHGGAPVILSSQLHPNLFFARTITGKKSVQQATVSAFPAETGRYYALFSIEDITDLSERIVKYRDMRDRARKLSEEKEVLLREMHHRIKNNLNIVAALIDVRTGGNTDKGEFADLKNQIRAIGLVHEKLYNSDTASAADPAEYIQEVLQAALSLHPGVTLELHCEAEDLYFGTERLIPVGLLCNEIAVNAVKHGFSGPGKAVFFAELKRNEEKNEYVLMLSNTGRPFPESVSIDKPASMGLKLITSLVRQLEGTIELRRSPRTEYTVRFPVR
jgi:PAS domain S-box-containing protein